MKKLIALLLLVSSFGFAQQTESFAQKLEKAKTEHKKVLLYFSGSDWCAPCIKFKKFIVNTEEFKNFATENLVLYNADFPRQSKNKLAKEIEKENEALAEKYNSRGQFPLILLLDENGNIVKKWEEYPKETVQEFIEKLKS
ncbi:Thioredoxin family protein [Flavobacterium indicum GPTSA100-9 = DSM 17447]|uniref:Thioredoxin family protein n=1 Tax=Flavobacterium indicum (strain DSM 17447 / CIP 109464 / GPTSA100-9) TaxID=1094466 RepID=H8XU71_FLAIG|nr:thioredoxin family protein [Flavobacterium indicum]CCG52854.1 Thioredoxin family protein [Flavobacterium indicum GPTSA100-9 = DSM 17447]